MFAIMTNYKNKKTKPNKDLFQNPYMHHHYIYSNLKTKFIPYGIKNIKQKQGQKHHTSSSPSKYFPSLSYQLLLIIKTTHFLMIAQSTYLISLGLNC
jgi:hypothetical protein